MIVRELLVKLGYKTDKKSQVAAKKGISALKAAAGGLAAVFVTGKLAQGFKAMINNASDAAETANKLGAVFGDLTPQVTDFSNKLATDIGQSRQTIQSFTADIGSLVKPLLGTADASAEMAQGVSQMAFDLASFENIKPEEALAKFRAGLVGSSEPLLTMGIDTRVAALEQFRLSEGIRKATKDMTAGEITGLRYQLMIKRMGQKGATGDALKTADGFANALRGLQGAVKDLSADIGTIFLGGTTELIVTLRDLAREMSGPLTRAAKVVKSTFEGLFKFVMFIYEGWRLLINTIGDLVQEFTGLNSSLVKTVLVIGTLAAILGLPVVLLGIIGATIVAIIDDLNAMGEDGESVIGGLITEFQRWQEVTGSIAGAVSEMLIGALAFWFGVSEKRLRELKDLFFDTFATPIANAVDFWRAQIGRFFVWLGEKLGGVGGKIAGFFGSDAGSQSATQAAAVSSVGNTSLTNAPNTTVNINVDANGVTDPQAVATQAVSQLGPVLDQQNRVAFNQLTTQGAPVP